MIGVDEIDWFGVDVVVIDQCVGALDEFVGVGDVYQWVVYWIVCCVFQYVVVELVEIFLQQ